MDMEFLASSKETENFVGHPKKSSLYLPEWYTDQKAEYKKCPKFNNDGRLVNTSIKMCMPFLDSLTHGYIQETWCDIYIEKNKNTGKVAYYYSTSPKIMGVREIPSTEQHNGEYYQFEFYWHIEWISKTPKGFSVLITHPLNRLDLPFTTMSAIVDSDVYHHAPSGNLPFLIKNGFEGLIPAGTPMYQIIPIKRENWSSKIVDFNLESEKRLKQQNSKFYEFYKKQFWQKKKFD